MKLNEVINSVRNLTENQIVANLHTNTNLKLKEILEVCKTEFPNKDYLKFKESVADIAVKDILVVNGCEEDE